MKSNNSKKGMLLKFVNFEQYVRLALSHAEFSQNEDGSWTAEMPVLPGCITWGATRSEAVEMAKDAAEAWVLTALRFGDEVPPIDGNSLQYAVDELGAGV
jgi:predicted RNase H-like HicB family nuclease